MRNLAKLVLVGVTPLAFAQGAPTAGSQLRQIPPAPVAQPASPAVLVEPPPPAAQPTAVTANRVKVHQLLIEGTTQVAPEVLVRESGFVAGESYTLSELRALAAKMVSYYRVQGYFIAQVFLPTQDITEGKVRLKVVEGQLGQVTVHNQSSLRDGVVEAILDDLKTKAALTSPDVERRLLMLTDLPGVNIRSAMKPGAAPGSSDIGVEVTPGPRMTGSVEGDNHGNPYTGSNRFGGSLVINEPLGFGDQASVRALTAGEGLNYGRASYQLQHRGITVGGTYTSLTYKLGGDFASSRSTGTASVGSLYLGYPFMRSRAANLWGQLELENKDYADRTGNGSATGNADKNTQNGVFSLRGDYQIANGQSQGNYQISVTHGTLKLAAGDPLTIDTSTAKTNGDFDKVSYSLAHQSRMGQSGGILFNLSGQFASKNLDSSEKFSLGGARGVRAFPSGEAAGDEGLIMSLEGRTTWDWARQQMPGQVQLLVFVDAGIVIINKNPWGTSTSSNRRTLTGAGLGLQYLHPSRWMLKAVVARKMGDEVATAAPDAPGRFWLEINKLF